MIIKMGSVGESVKEIQKLLGFKKPDGIFGTDTENAVKLFQIKNKLNDDGVVGPKTYAVLLKNSTTSSYTFMDVDNQVANLGDFVTKECLTIHKRYLDSDQFVSDSGTTEKDTLFIHHTAGRGNPFKTVSNWNLDTRGRIATQFCIGRTSLEKNTEFNGVVVETFPDEYYAWHLGKVGSQHMHEHSVGIEINNWGWLTEKNGKFYTYVNIEVPKEQVTDLGKSFLGYRYYQSYTPEQMESLRKLIIEVKRRHPKIDLNKGLKEWLTTKTPFEAFSFNNDAYNGRINGVLSHTNVRKDKTDCYPHPDLIKVLKNI